MVYYMNFKINIQNISPNNLTEPEIRSFGLNTMISESQRGSGLLVF